MDGASNGATLKAAASKSMGDSEVGIQGTGEAGRERRGGPKVLLEGAPLKAASRQEGREGSLGLPKMLVSWWVSSMMGALGGSRMNVEGDWRVLDGLGVSKIAESKVSTERIVGGPRGEGIECRASSKGSSSDRGDRREGLAGYWDTGDASESRR